MIPVTCPQCGTHMEVDEKFSGRNWVCGACGEQVLVLGQPWREGEESPPIPANPPQMVLPTSGKAIASLVLGLLTLFGVGFCISGLPGIFLGQLAKEEISQGLCSGHEMARAGIILSVIGLLWPIVLILGIGVIAVIAETFAQ